MLGVRASGEGRSMRWLGILSILFYLVGCGNDATFRGSALDKLKGVDSEEPEGDDEDVPTDTPDAVWGVDGSTVTSA